MDDTLKLPVEADTSNFVQEIARATAALVEFAKAEDEARKQAAEQAKANREGAEARKKAAEEARKQAAAVREQAKADKEAADAAKKAAEEEKKRGDGVDQFNQKLKDIGDSIGKYTFAFNQVTAAISTVAGAVRDGVESVVRLGGEFNRIQGAARETGINFDAAARSTGAYVDKLQLATNAMRFNQAGQTITQRQMEALIARAREFSRVNGDFAGSFDALTDAVLEGEEDGLRRFGGSLASLGGEAHTVQERLQALTQDVQHQAAQVVTAGDRWERFKGELQDFGREASGNFMRGLTESLNDADRSVQHVQERAEQGKMTWGEFFEALGHGVEAERQAFGAAKDAVDSLVYAILALGGTADAANDAALNWRQAAEQIERAGVALGEVQARQQTAAPIEGAPDPNEGPSLSDSIRRFGGDLLSQGRNVVDVASGRGRLGQAAIQQARGFERKRDAATLAARPDRQAQEGPKQVGRMVGNLFENPRESFAAQLGFTGESPDSLAVMDEEAGTEANWIANNTGKSAAQRAVNEAAFGQSDEGRLRDRRRERQSDRERREQDLRLDQRESFLERWERLNQREIVANDVLAESMSMGFNVITTSFSDHLRTLLEGNEAGAQFWEKMAADTMAALGKEAFGKAAFYAAESLGFLVMGNLPQAGTAAAASAAYGVAGAALTYGAAEMGAFAQDTKGSGGGGGGGGGSPSRPRLAGDSGGASGSNTQTIVNHYYAPTFGGRQGSDAEAGVRMGRYTGAADRRVQRDRT